MCRHFEAGRHRFDIVGVTHPHNRIARPATARRLRAANAKAGKQTAAIINRNLGSAVFTDRSRRNLAAQLVSKKLRAVADAKHRNAELKNLRIALRGILAVHTVRTARQNNPGRSQCLQLIHRNRVRMNLAIYITFTDTAGNQLVILAAEVQNYDIFSHKSTSAT